MHPKGTNFIFHYVLEVYKQFWTVRIPLKSLILTKNCFLLQILGKSLFFAKYSKQKKQNFHVLHSNIIFEHIFWFKGFKIFFERSSNCFLRSDKLGLAKKISEEQKREVGTNG